MLRRELIAEAVADAAAQLEANSASEVQRPEERLRRLLRKRFEVDPAVEHVRQEWQPALPRWPEPENPRSRLGGFDLALRFVGEEHYSTAIELKWSRHGYLDALDEVLWDLFKLTHVSATVVGVVDALLVYLAPVKAWEKPARFATLFEDAFVNTARLTEEYESIWRWCLRGSSASRPNSLPPYIQTGLVARAPLSIAGERLEIRVASVRPVGQPWIELDGEGMPLPESERAILPWPYPAPGPGMHPKTQEDEFVWPSPKPSETASSELHASDLPKADATWREICWFAAQFNGYERYGRENLAEMANAAIRTWQTGASIDPNLTLDDLRGCLFFEYRRFHHFGHAPDGEATPYLRALVEAIQTKVEQAVGEVLHERPG